MQHKDKKAESLLQKFRPRSMQRLSDILKPDVLDDETRNQIVQNVMRAEIHISDDSVLPATEEPSSCRQNPQEGLYPTNLRRRVSGGNSELLGTMARRLTTLESQQQAYRMELKEKTEKLILSEDMCRAEKAKREEVETLLLELYNDKKELEEEVEEMRKFLADYGLCWVGNKNCSKDGQLLERENVQEEGTTSASENLAPFELYAGDYVNRPPAVISRSPNGAHSVATGDSKVTPVQNCSSHTDTHAAPKNDYLPLPAPMDVLKRHAQILSDHVGTKGVFCNGKQGGIRELETVRVVVYQDGITVNGGLFRPFGWPLCDAVLNDLADGYYPYEFKQRYPEGFPIEVVDKMSVCCPANAAATNRVNNVKELQQMQNDGYKSMSRDEFLGRLPDTRITANGRIINVRGEIAKMIGIDPQSEGGCILRHLTEAERQKMEKVVNKSNPEGATIPTCGYALAPPQRVKGMVSVLLRFPSGTKVVLHLAPENTIADLRKEIEVAVPSFTLAYDVRLSFPAVTYSDDRKTLRELGLLTNCTLMIQPKTHAPGT